MFKLSYMNQHKKDILEKLRSTGYCVIPNYLSAYECERLTRHIDSCMTNYVDKVQRDFKEGLGGDYRLFGLENTDKAIYDTLYNNEYLDVLRIYVNNPETTPCTVMAGVIEAPVDRTDRSKINSGGGWHRDPGTQHCTKVKTIIYLTDVSSTNGPFTIIPNSLASQVGTGRTRTEDCPKIHQGLRIYDDFVEELATKGGCTLRTWGDQLKSQLEQGP